MPRGVETRKAGEPFELHAELERRRTKAEPPPAAVLFDGVHRCARCGGSHFTPITALPLVRPVVWGNDVVATHWFWCPTNGHPVLVLANTEGVEVARDLAGGERGVSR